MFKSVTEDEHYVYFVLANDNTTIPIPKFDIAKTKNIRFVDPFVKAICVSNWDTNGDWELSYEEAAAVTDIGTVFQGEGLGARPSSVQITSFNELKYFTGLTNIPANAFKSCLMLLQITLPDNIISIGESAFEGCSKLYGNLIIPDKVESIGDKAFFGCTGFKGILVIGSGVKKIGGYAFTYSLNNYYKLNFSKIYCKSTTVPVMGTWEGNYFRRSFCGEGQEKCSYLGVPNGCKSLYNANSTCMLQFIKVEEVDFNSIY